MIFYSCTMVIELLYGLSRVDGRSLLKPRQKEALMHFYNGACMLYASTLYRLYWRQSWSAPVLQLNRVLCCWFHPLCSWSWLARSLGYRKLQKSSIVQQHCYNSSRILVVCIFRVMQLCDFMVYFTVKYMNSLVHTHYYPCNRYLALFFCTSVHPFHCVRKKLGLGTRLKSYVLQTFASSATTLKFSGTKFNRNHKLRITIWEQIRNKNFGLSWISAYHMTSSQSDHWNLSCDNVLNRIKHTLPCIKFLNAHLVASRQRQLSTRTRSHDKH